jgi:hypothetical protein
MSIEFIGVIALIFGIAAMIWFENIKFEVLIFITLLGSSAAIVFSTMSISIQPAHLLLALFLASILATKGAWRVAIDGVTFGKPGFWLAATVVYGSVGAFLFPRLFGGLTYVNAIGATAEGFSRVPTPLGPSSGNFTQTVYFAGDLAAFLIAYVWSQSDQGRRGFGRALFVYAIGNVIFAAADLITFWTGTGYLLDFIRNSTYTLHNETVVLGLKRIVGSFTETSAFAYASIGAMACMLSLWLDGVKPRLTLILALTTAGLLIFSTSTTAYGALPIFMTVIFVSALARTVYRRVTPERAAFVIISPLSIAMAALVLLQTPSLLETMSSYADILIFNKSNSASGIERAEWNASALRNFFETYGFGAGIGSVRASSFSLAVLANLGLFGSFTYAAFLASLFFGRTRVSDEIAPYRTASQWSCFALIVASCLSGALIDLGLFFFFMAGFIGACADSASRETSQSEIYASRPMRGAVA